MNQAVRDGNLGYLSTWAVQGAADRIAIRDLSGGRVRTFSYAQLEARQNRVAQALIAAGLTPGDRVALAIGNRAEMVEALFGAMRALAVPVLVNIRQSAEVMRYTLVDAGCTAAIVEPGCNPNLAAALEGLPLRLLMTIDDRLPGSIAYELSLAAASADDPALSPPSPSAACMMPYTSGSTGRPKGVVLSQGGHLWFARMHRDYVAALLDGAEARALVAVPMFHKNALVGGVKPVLALGGTMVIVDRFDAAQVVALIAEERIAFMPGVAALFGMLLQQSDLVRRLDFTSFRFVFSGAAPSQGELLRRVEDVLGITVRHVYGLTEGGPGVLSHPPGPRGPLDSCGKPNPGVEVRLVGPDGADSDQEGELWVRNPGLAVQYHNLPELTRQRLAGGWLRTGDLMRRDALGWFYFRGRTDDMFNCGGENVYAIEVENVLLMHPAVRNACVVPIPHGAKGEAPAAMVMLAPDGRLGEDELKSFYLSKGPAYSHPRVVVFADALPLSPTEKVDRGKVRDSIMVEVARRHAASAAAAEVGR